VKRLSDFPALLMGRTRQDVLERIDRLDAGIAVSRLAGRPWRSLRSIYAAHLESPGIKAYSMAEARALFAAFGDVRITTVLTHGDLLESGAGQRHGGLALTLARRIWPRRLIRYLFPKAGLFMLIEARK
jgi:hypothetical protein